MTSVTVFSKEGSCYKKYVFNKATVHFLKGIDIGDNGYTKSNKCVIRIFDYKNAQIMPEDKVEIGLGSEYPSKDALTVICVTDNMRGTHGHIKVDCV